MNRRRFLRSIAKGVLTVVAVCYAPGLLKAPTFQGIPIRAGKFEWILPDWRVTRLESVVEDLVGGGLTDTLLANMTLAMRKLKDKKPVFYMSKETRDRLLG